MAINPLGRIINFDVPSYPRISQPLDASAFSGLGTLGQAIANRREEAELADIMRSATDSSGNLDLNKAATAIALSGRDPIRYLTALTAQRGEQRGEAAQRALEKHYGATEELARKTYELARERYEAGDVSVEHPTIIRPGQIIRTPPGKPPVIMPYPTAPAVAPGPQSALEPEPSQAMAFAGPVAPPGGRTEPGGNIPLQPRGPGNPLGPPPVAPTQLPFDFENAPPYRVAGPPMPPPQPAAQPAVEPPPVVVRRPEKPAPAFNENYLATLPSEAARTVIKGVANYEIDPASFSGKDREDVVAAAKLYRPDYNQTEFQKRQQQLPAEVAARVGLGSNFLDRVPNIEARLRNNELNTLEGRGMAYFGQGGPGELRRAIDEGAEALLRGLTGAGMNKDEAASYQRRYQTNLIDTKETQLRKLNELETALRYVGTEVGKGRGGQDFLKDFTSKFGQRQDEGPKRVTNGNEATAALKEANDFLNRVPPGRRGEALKDVHNILRAKNVPPELWPR